MSVAISKCPENELLEEYKSLAKDNLTTDQMTADQVWVYCHIKECDDCRNQVES